MSPQENVKLGILRAPEVLTIGKKPELADHKRLLVNAVQILGTVADYLDRYNFYSKDPKRITMNGFDLSRDKLEDRISFSTPFSFATPEDGLLPGEEGGADLSYDNGDVTLQAGYVTHNILRAVLRSEHINALKGAAGSDDSDSYMGTKFIINERGIRTQVTVPYFIEISGEEISPAVFSPTVNKTYRTFERAATKDDIAEADKILGELRSLFQTPN